MTGKPNSSGAVRSAPWRLSLVFWLVAGIGFAQAGAAGPAKGSGTREMRRTRLHAIASSSMFISVNRNDAVASVKAWFEIVGRERGFEVDSRVDVLDSVAEMRQRLEKRSADLLILDFADYMQLEASGLVVPDLVGTRANDGAPLYSYVLLVNPNSTARTIGDLRGKNILLSSRNLSNVGQAWLDVVLARQKLGQTASFFATSRTVTKAQGCVLPLFFGSIDACVVDEINLDLLKEMNPQVGKLRVLARSTPLLENVIATPVEPHPHRRELLDAILELHRNPQGRQLLMVFKTGRLVKAQPAEFSGVREIWREYSRLPGATSRAAAGSAQTPAGAPATGHGLPRD